MKMQSGLEGAGAAFLLLYSYYLPLLHPKNHALFHHDLPITSLIGGILLDLLVVAILAAGFLAVVQRLPQAVRRIVEALFAGLMLWSAVALANQVFIDMWFPISRWGNLWAQCVLAIPLLMSARLHLSARHSICSARRPPCTFGICFLLYLDYSAPALYRAGEPSRPERHSYRPIDCHAQQFAATHRMDTL
jgi:hypothetical protein